MLKVFISECIFLRTDSWPYRIIGLITWLSFALTIYCIKELIQYYWLNAAG